MSGGPRPRADSRSLRFRLPALLLLYFGVAGGLLYLVANDVQEAEFERDFVRTHLVHATEIQSRTERAAERREIETGQREFGELAVFEEIRAAVLVSPADEVVLGSRREWLGQVVDLSALGVPDGEQAAVGVAMRQVRGGGGAELLFSADRNTLTVVLPVITPVEPDGLGVDRGSLILLVHDLSLAKAINRVRLRRQFAVGAVVVFLAVVGLGVGLQLFVTRRIERLHGAMGRFAAGEPVDDDLPASTDAGGGSWTDQDEIAQVHRHFAAIAADRRRKEEELQRVNRALRTISSANQVLVRATEEADLLREVCRVVVEEGEHALAGVTYGDRPGSDLQLMSWAGEDRGYFERLSTVWCGGGAETSATFEAIRSGRPVLRADLQAAASSEPWCREASVSGFHAVVALPLVARGERVGVLSIYSRAVAAFDRAEVALLVELADDLAFGVHAIRLRQERRQVADEMTASNTRYARREEALATLMRGYVSTPEDFRRLVREVTEVSAAALDVAEVAFWRRDERSRSAVCEDLYERRTGRHVEGLTLREVESPSCFRALALADVVAAHDARADERTADLGAALLTPRDIGAMMVLSIRSGGTTVGMLTVHVTGARHRWTPDEQAFSVAVANLLSALVAQTERQRLEAQLRQAQKLEASDSSPGEWRTISTTSSP